MARIPQPTIILIQMYDKEYGYTFDDGLFYEINRAYQRVNGKFEPIGWAVEGYNVQRDGFELRVYTDSQVRQYELGQIS